jgi:hypothetical protein
MRYIRTLSDISVCRPGSNFRSAHWQLSAAVVQKKGANGGPRLTPEGLWPRHPRRSGRREGNAGQHGTRAATREGASNCAPDQQQTHVHQQARPHQQQKPQPKGHSRQEPSRQRCRAGTSGQEAERVQRPRHAKAEDIRRVKRVNMQRLAHPRSSNSVTRQEIQAIKPQISRIRAIRRGSRAAEKDMLDAAPAAYHKGVPSSSTRRWRSNAMCRVKRCVYCSCSSLLGDRRF